MEEETAASIVIPMRGSEEFVEVRPDELPEESEVLLEVLEGELAPLSVWLDVAVAYFKHGQTQQFLDILNKATEMGAEEHYRANKHDRIVVLNALAAYYTQLAGKTRDKAEKQKYFAEATQHYNRADKIDIQEGVTWVGKGVLYLQKMDKQRALREFDMVLSWQAENTPALLGRACALYQRGQYQDALQCYKKVLTTNPACPPSVRFGLGLCYFKLEKTHMAQLCFERVLELEPDNVEAIVALSVLDFNKGTSACVRQGTERLTKAFAANPNHPRVLNYLANHFFYKGEYGHVHTMADTSLSSSEVAKINGESCFHLARNYQAQGDYDSAFEYYSKAIQHWPSFPLAQYGLAQMCVYKGNAPKAIKLLQHVLKHYPDNYEATKMLASLYVGTSNENLSRQYLGRITELYPTDWESWIELGQLQEKVNPVEALKSFESAARIRQKAMADKQEEGQSAAALVPTQLLNNIAVLKHKTGDFEGAEKVYLETITRSGAAIDDFLPENITTSFNLARLYEDTKRFKEAEFLYSGILKAQPKYADCYLRLGCISRAKGDLSGAEEWYSTAFNVDVNHLGGWTMLGNLHMQKQEWKQAQQKFEHILKTVNKRDSYALLAMGNIYLNARHESKERAAKNLKYAMDHFFNVLQRQKNNLYAVNGLGIVMAEKGLLSEARTCFMKVWEAVASGIEVPDVWINLGNVYLLQGNYSGAVLMYENCLKKFYENSDDKLFLLLANALYLSGKLDETFEAIQNGLKANPDSLLLKYNHAVCLKTFASSTIRKKSSELSPELVQLALDRAKEAANLFGELIEAAGQDGARRQYSTTKCTQMQEYCGELEKAAELLKAKVQKKHEEAEEKRQENLRLAEEVRKVMLQKKLEQERKKEEERVAREEKARLDLEKLTSAKAAWENAASTRKRKAPDSGFDDSDSEEEAPVDDGDGDESGKKTKKKKAAQPKAKRKAPAKKRKKKDESNDSGGDTRADSDEDMPSDDDFEDSFAAMRDARNPRLKQLADKMRQQEEAAQQQLKNRRRRPRLEETATDFPDSDDENSANPEEAQVRQQLTDLLDSIPDEEIPTVTFNVIVSRIAEKHGDADLLRKHKRYTKTVAAELLGARAPK